MSISRSLGSNDYVDTNYKKLEQLTLLRTFCVIVMSLSEPEIGIFLNATRSSEMMTNMDPKVA